MEISIISIFLTLGAGLASVLSPCVLPVIPIIVTGSENDSKHRPIFIVVGLSITFMIMGVISTLMGQFIGGKIFYIEKAAGIIIIILGFLMLIDINLFKKMTIFNKLANRSSGKLGGFFLGFTLGIIWIPCVGGPLTAVLTAVGADGGLLNGIFMLLIYSIGFSIPMLIAGYFSQFFRTKIRSMGQHPEAIRYISGSILILFGIFIITKGVMGFSS